MAKKKRESAPEGPKYAGFSLRLFASLVDMLLTFFMIAPFFPQGSFPPALQDILYKQRSGQISEREANALLADYLFNDGGLANALSMRFTETLVFGVIVVLFWIYRAATPGKMLFGLKIVDGKTGNRPSTVQCIIRYLGYFASGVPLGIGFIWIQCNKKRRGWHDYLAGTVVIVEQSTTVWERIKQPFEKYLKKNKKV